MSVLRQPSVVKIIAARTAVPRGIVLDFQNGTGLVREHAVVSLVNAAEPNPGSRPEIVQRATVQKLLVDANSLDVTNLYFETKPLFPKEIMQT